MVFLFFHCVCALLRHTLDGVLVAVLALCAVDNDLLHAGYLAIALYFFRCRAALR